MDAAVAQMNVRMDAELKVRGDRVLEKAGLTPTRAVRALWERIGALADRPHEVVELLQPTRDVVDPDAEAERQRKLKAAEEGAQIVARSLADRGIDIKSTPVDDTPYEELRERVLLERLQERGLDR